MDIEDLIEQILSCASYVRKTLGDGFLESVYQSALMKELEYRGIPAEKEVPIKIYFRDEPIADFRADILVDKRVILELKAVSDLNQCHERQLINYLKATKIDHGLLLNFGGYKLEAKRKFRIYKATH